MNRTYVQDDRFNYSALVIHVVDDRHHVPITGSDQGWAKNNRQVMGIHLKFHAQIQPISKQHLKIKDC